MQIKTFRALDMREALRAVKEELGPAAVILSTQEVRSASGAFGLFSRTLVEVTAAVDREEEDLSGREPTEEGGRPGGRGVGGWNEEGGRPGGRGQKPRASTEAILSHGSLVRGWENLQKGRQKPERLGSSFHEHMQGADGVEAIREDLAQIREELKDLRRLSVPGAGDHEGWTAFEEDLRGVRRLVGTLVKNDRDLFVEQLPAPLKAAYGWLLDTGLSMDVVFTVIHQLQADLPLDDQQLPDRLRGALLTLIASEVNIFGPLLEEDGTSKAVMLVGPSGVGKTTTIAKLAALYALQQKRKVALITLDTYRVAAVEQLRVYGTILGLSVDVALTCEDLAGLLRMRRSADLILIDTAGRSPLDQAAMRELKKLVGPNRQVEAHLLLSAATREADLSVILDRFMTLPVKSLIFSKLDETTQFGSLFNVLQRTGLPLSYLSTGQRVPEDLEVATPKRLAEVLLDGIAAVKKVHQRDQATSRHTPNAPVETMKHIPLIAEDPASKRNLLGTLGWALGRRSGTKKSAE